MTERWGRVAISDAEAHPDYYHRDLDAYFEKIEAHAGRAFKRLVSEDLPMRLEDRERRSASRFMAVQLVRTPWFFREVLPLATKHWLDENFGEGKIGAERYLSECRRLSILRPGRTNPPNVLGVWVSDELNKAVDAMTQSFYAANWTIVEVSPGLDQVQFFTADNPVSLAETDDNPEAGALMPLSPSRVLVVGVGRRRTIELETVSLPMARDIRKITVLASDRYLYASRRQEWVSEVSRP